MVHVRTARLTQADGGRWTMSTAPRQGDDSRWFVEDVDGWYGGSGLRGGATPSYNHGTFLSRGFREGRTLTLHGWVENVDTDTRDWQERNISGMLWDGMTGELTCDDGNAVMTTRVRLDGPPQVVPIGVRDLQFQVPLVSESPFLYGDWREFTMDPPGLGVGFEFPPLSRDLGKGPVITFGTERVREEHFVWNEGNADSYPRFTVHADSPGGFSVGLVDRLVTYPWPTYADVPVTVDMEGALFVGGRDQTHLLHERNWSKVPPRTIDTPVFRFLQGGRGFCTVAHRDTYI